MKSVLSHIVQKQFSGEYENIATEALAYIVQTNDRARGGLLKMLRGVKPDLPNLSFQTQQSENKKRPDIWGLDSGKPCVFIENKFWAGFTENQPVEYIKLLATHHSDGLLLMVVPAARQESSWREMLKRLGEAAIGWEEYKTSADIRRVVKTGNGPLLALTTWTKLLQSIDDELADEPQARNDLIQLKALCETAESDAYVPLSAAEITNQRLPAMIAQLNRVSQRAFEVALTEGFINKEGTATANTYERIGRTLKFTTNSDVLTWLGLSFSLWQKHGMSPLWLIFSTKWGRAPEVREIIEPWAETEDIFTTTENSEFGINMKVPAGEDFDFVVRDIVNQLRDIGSQISVLPKNMED
jgi:hypothetical protein